MGALTTGQHDLLKALNLLSLSLVLADRTVRSDIELYAACAGTEEDGHPIYDTRRLAEDGPEEEDLLRVQWAMAYIDARGDVFPWRMKRYIDAPYLVRFEDREPG
ncbi:hypothetical protein CSC62_13980 [Pseudoxanthomonas jiangsuensis]|uniref:hypothetical protein n=1 Tax=Pseudoxanthomonas jiangsuensis TaxID=619688 RepID=UPI0013907877|nr:hypothetical protein [Pseudoxanthomonas jiangsuensis]KAF1692739.1 hypothetical protein CSC62_13980 [Pseudoxanthomonas jiangsuensis]